MQIKCCCLCCKRHVLVIFTNADLHVCWKWAESCAIMSSKSCRFRVTFWYRLDIRSLFYLDETLATQSNISLVYGCLVSPFKVKLNVSAHKSLLFFVPTFFSLIPPSRLGGQKCQFSFGLGRLFLFRVLFSYLCVCVFE